MLFTSSIFAFGFLPVTLFFYYIIFRNNRKMQNIFLTVMSLIFYAWGEPLFVFVMLSSCIMNWSFALKINTVREDKQRAKRFVVLMAVCNLLLLFVFKYLSFAAINLLFFIPHLPSFITKISLPIGISFFTFQSMSYCFDVYNGNEKVQKKLLNVILYVSFFPALIAGPIVRYSTIAKQIEHREETVNDFLDGFYRFMIGFSKKWILANNLAPIVDMAFDAESPSVSLAWLGALAYTFQIFFDFSAYSDMAIGLSKMFGFYLLENFKFPYISKSISEFWRRWHISLGTWFRDYVYIPLGGSRVNKKRLVFNFFVIWSLTGVWHGANWTFIIWGLLYFALITVERLTGFNKKLGFFGHIYTMFFVVIGWVFFRADSLTAAVKYLSTMFGMASDLFNGKTIFALREYGAFLIIATIFSFVNFSGDNKILKTVLFGVVKNIVVIVAFIVAISYMVTGSHNPFIYFNF